jgi:DNA-binding NarL/FixJ family response regulator
VVVAHTSFDWVRSAVARGDVDLVLLGIEDARVGPSQVEELRHAWPGLNVVVISDSSNPDVLAATVRAGARGWLRPAASSRHLIQAVHGVARGETWLPPDLATVVLDRLLTVERTRAASLDAMSGLTSRELEILACLAQGMTRRQIADRYKLSPHTVRTHINHVLSKLDVHTTLAAVAIARKARTSEQRPA